METRSFKYRAEVPKNDSEEQIIDVPSTDGLSYLVKDCCAILYETKGKRKNYPKRHIQNKRCGRFCICRIKNCRVTELTWEEVGVNPKGHATYVIK